jgi:predicted O-methyltransferase YrrM
MDLFKLRQLAGYFIYRFRENHHHGFGVHSPFMYRFIREVIEGSLTKDAFRKIEQLRYQLVCDKRIINGPDLGAGSKRLNRGPDSLGLITKYSSVNPKMGRLLCRIASDLKPDIILEFGTSVGIGSMYLASANPDIEVHTVEGNPMLAEVAAENFKRLDFENIILHNKSFREFLSDPLLAEKRRVLVWVDGDHRGESMKMYLEILLGKAAPGSIIIFDDIRWSSSMYKGWKDIQKNPSIAVTVDLWNTGITFIFNELQKQNYLVKF